MTHGLFVQSLLRKIQAQTGSVAVKQLAVFIICLYVIALMSFHLEGFLYLFPVNSALGGGGKDKVK